MNELLQQIERAEAEGARIRADAASEAREMAKSVEEACITSERQSQRAARDAAMRLVEEAKQGAQDEINALSVRRSAERELMRGLAQRKLNKVAALIAERIVQHGDC